MIHVHGVTPKSGPDDGPRPASRVKRRPCLPFEEIVRFFFRSPMSARERRDFGRHLARCSRCRGMLRALERAFMLEASARQCGREAPSCNRKFRVRA